MTLLSSKPLRILALTKKKMLPLPSFSQRLFCKLSVSTVRGLVSAALILCAVVVQPMSVERFNSKHRIVNGRLGKHEPYRKASREDKSLNSSSSVARSESNQNIEQLYGNLPIGFVANQGQTDPRVKFFGRGEGYAVFLTDSDVLVALRKPVISRADRSHSVRELRKNKGATTEVLRMRLPGSNRHAQINALEEAPSKVNYFSGRNIKNWKTDVKTY